MVNWLYKATLVLCCFSFVFFEAQSQGWREYYNQSVTSYEADQLDQAYEQASKCLQQYLSESGAANENYASILRHFGNVCFSLEKYDQGIELINKEIAIREAKQDQLLASARLNLAEFYKQQEKYVKAIEQILISEKILQNYYQPTDQELVSCRLNLAITYYQAGIQRTSLEILQKHFVSINNLGKLSEDELIALYYFGVLLNDAGKSEEALQVLNQAKGLWEKSDRANSSEFSQVLYSRGQLYYQANQLKEAEDSYRAAQELWESLNQTDEVYLRLLGDRAINLQAMGQPALAEKLYASIQSHPEAGSVYAISLSNRATSLQSRGELEEAEKLYSEALTKFNQSDKEQKLLYADTQSNLGILKSDQGKNQEALQLLVEAKNTYEAAGSIETIGYVNVLNKLGTVYLKANNVQQASQVFDAAMTQISKVPSVGPMTKLQTLTGVGSVAFQEGKIATADSIFSKVVSAYENQSLKSDVNYLAALNNLASVKQMQGKLKVSRDLMRSMSNQASKIYGKESRLYANALNSLAMLDFRLGFTSEAKLAIDSAMDIYVKIKATESTDYAHLLASKAKYYQMQGNYNLAEPEYRTAIEIVGKNEGEQSIEYAQLLNSQALLLQTLGNYAEAEKLLMECKQIIEVKLGRNNTDYSTALQNLAALYQVLGRLPQAEKMLEEAQAIDRIVLGEMHPQYAVLIQNLATLYQKTGRAKESEKYLNSALKNYEFNFGKINSSYATTVGNLASLYQDESRWSEAEVSWKESLSIRKELVGEEHPDYVRAQLGLAGLYHAQAKFADAELMYDPVIKNYQNQVKEFFPSMSEREKTAFFAKVKSAFDSYIDFAIEYGNTNPARKAELLTNVYNLQLVNKAILLSASSKVRSKILSSNDAQLLSQYQEWLRTKELILKWYTQFTIEERNQANIKELESRANDLEKSLSLQSSFFKEGMDQGQVTFTEVQSSLSAQESAVEILRIKKRYVKDSVYYLGLVLNNQSTSPHSVIFKYGEKLENRFFKFLRNSIKFSYPDTISYDLFWKPLETELTNTQTVFISCDGVFNKVNFNVLKSKTSNQFVIDKWLVRRLSNTRELVEMRKSNVVGSLLNNALLVGYADFNLEKSNVTSGSEKRSVAHFFGFDGEEIPVLPATEKEIETLGALMDSKQWKVKRLMQAEATEENVKKIEGQSVVHIASHGFFLTDVSANDGSLNEEFLSNPLFQSGILLSGAAVPDHLREGREDGVLTAYEAMNLNLDNTELVALSACETGLGEIQNGEGVFGLQRSFLMAGANSILMSLWQVDDVATQELMVHFYSIWLGGAGKHEAFRQAQLKIKESYPEPYFWGGFIMVGK